MRLIWLLPSALAGCAMLQTPPVDMSPMPDDLRDAPAVRSFPDSAGEALYLRLVSMNPEAAAQATMGLPLEDHQLLAEYVGTHKGHEDFWTARFELDPHLSAHESAFLCWYLGGFSRYATLGRR